MRASCHAGRQVPAGRRGTCRQQHVRPSASSVPQPGGRGSGEMRGAGQLARAIIAKPVKREVVTVQRELSEAADSWEWPTATLLGTGLDSLETAGIGHTQQELGNVLGDKIMSGQILCCTKTVRDRSHAPDRPWLLRSSSGPADQPGPPDATFWSAGSSHARSPGREGEEDV